MLEMHSSRKLRIYYKVMAIKIKWIIYIRISVETE